MGTEKKRLEIINRLRATFREAETRGIGIDKERLISEISLNYGTTRIKSLEYLNVLLNSKFIIEVNGVLSLFKSEDGLTHEEQEILSSE